MHRPMNNRHRMFPAPAEGQHSEECRVASLVAIFGLWLWLRAIVRAFTGPEWAVLSVCFATLGAAWWGQ